MSGLTVEQILASDNVTTLDPEFDGHCPCFTLQGDGFRVDVHCWRVSLNDCGCEHSGIHVHGLDEAEAFRVADHIRRNNPWSDRSGWRFWWNPTVVCAG